MSEGRPIFGYCMELVSLLACTLQTRGTHNLKSFGLVQNTLFCIIKTSKQVPRVIFNTRTIPCLIIFSEFCFSKHSFNYCFFLFLDGTSALTAPLPSELVTRLTEDVIKMKNWNKLRILYLGGGGSTPQPLGEGGLATNIDASSIPLGEIIRHFGPKQYLLISALLENGASANLIAGSDIIPLNEAMRQEDYPIVEKLVRGGANCCVASKEDEPIIHKALGIGLRNGNLIAIFFTKRKLF